MSKPKDVSAAFELALDRAQPRAFVLRLYVAGTSSQSTRAIIQLKEFCETHLKGRYHLEVVDIYQQPELAKDEQIIAVPTLIRRLPLPLRRLIGDLSNEERVLVGLDLQTQTTKTKLEKRTTKTRPRSYAKKTRSKDPPSRKAR
jgi:circadian clock protein KaiB